MWLPEEKTSIGIRESSSHSSSVIPKPPAAFSMLTTVKSIRRLSMSGSSASWSARRPGAPTTSPTKSRFMRDASARVLHGARLPNDRDLDLAGILELRLDLLGHVAGEPERLVVGQARRLDDDPQLPSGLDGERLLDALEAVRDVLELLQALDVRLQDLAAGARPCGGERVGPVDEDGLEGPRLVVAVVALHRVDDVVVLPELLQHLAAELEVRPLHLPVDRLTDVVQQAGPLGDIAVGAELRRHVGGEPRDFLGVLEDVLAVRGAVLEPPEKLDELRVEVRDRELQRRRLAFLADLFPQLGADLLYDLFDAGRMDAAVRDQLLQRHPGDLAAKRLEGRDDDRLRGVVDDQVHACRRLERANVAPLAADDAAFQVVRRQLDDRYGRLDDRVRGQALDRHPDQAPGLLGGLLHRLFLDPADQAGGLDPGLVLDGLDQVPLGIHGREAGDLLQPPGLLLDQLVSLGLPVLDPLLGVREALLLAAELLLPALLLGELPVEVLLLLDDPLLQRRDLLPADLHRLVELRPGGEDLLLGLDRGFTKLRLGGPVGLGEDAVGLRPNVLALGVDLLFESHVGDGEQHGGYDDARRDRDRETCIHLGSPAARRRRSRCRLHDCTEVLLPPSVHREWIPDRFSSHSLYSCTPDPSRDCRRRAFRHPGRRPVSL